MRSSRVDSIPSKSRSWSFWPLATDYLELRTENRQLTTALRQLATGNWQLLLPLWLLLIFPILAPAANRKVIDETGRTVMVPEHPQRIISIAPSVTELLYALGLAQRVVGRSDYCDYPPEVRQKPSVGGLIDPNIEVIVSLHPDLVIGTPEINKIAVADELMHFGIPLYGVHTTSVDDVFRALEDVGALTGNQAQADALVRSLRERRDAVVNQVAGRPRPRVLYLVWYNPISVPGRGAYITDLISLAGGESISGDLKQDWAQLSLEEIVRRDPEIILLPKNNGNSPAIEQMRSWPGWSHTTAVQTNRIFKVEDNASRPGPRLFDALEQFAKYFHQKTN
ncbi:MAG: cobalamin-binding protein [Acidobacteriia bacterium]|nr:cobalamin-binding protein [Terriglobia bacterium]